MESSFFSSYIRTQLHRIAALVSTASCGEGAGGDGAECRDEAAALRLKMAAVAAILVASAAGVAVPLAGRERCLGTGGALALVKAFAAGVVLATGFVHVLNDAEEALSDPCLPEDAPWRRFPFAGFVAMLAALGTLAVDIVCTRFYERRLHRSQQEEADAGDQQQETAALLDDSALTDITVAWRGDDATDAMHVAGTSAHAAAQRHSRSHGHGHGDGELLAHESRGHGHGHDAEPSLARRVVVSQILELGIVSHSVIIGLSLGVSQSPCTIKPLVAALSFHQFFEGFALGGCISEAQFNNLTAFLMALFFVITTPAGIILGVGIASFYNSNSPRALIVEGILDSLSAGILIYMALVDLIAADFLSQRMSGNPRLQLGSYIALFLGAMAMSALAIWT